MVKTLFISVIDSEFMEQKQNSECIREKKVNSRFDCELAKQKLNFWYTRELDSEFAK